MTPIEREIEADRETWLERVNIHLEKLLEKENKENNMLRHMNNHYWARNHVYKECWVWSLIILFTLYHSIGTPVP